MTIKRLLLLSSLLLTVSNVSRVEARGVVRAPGTPPTVALVRGSLQIQTANGLVLSVFRLRLRLADGAAVSGTLEEAGRETARDDAGEFERLRFRLKPAQASEVSKRLNAVLEVRRYANTGVLVVALEYEGPPLAPREGVQLL